MVAIAQAVQQSRPNRDTALCRHSPGVTEKIDKILPGRNSDREGSESDSRVLPLLYPIRSHERDSVRT